MRVDEAILVFERLGEPVRGKTAEQVKHIRNRLLQRHHTDHGGSTQTTMQILAAFEIIQDGVPEVVFKAKPPAAPPGYTYRRTSEEIDAATIAREQKAKQDKEAELKRREQNMAMQADFMCDSCRFCEDQGKLIFCSSRRDTIFRMKICHRYASR